MHIQCNLHFIYQQDLYKDKQKEIYELFIEYLVPVVEYIDRSALIEEWKLNLYASAYENNLNQDVKIPPIKKNIDCNEKNEKPPTIIKEILNWLPF